MNFRIENFNILPNGDNLQAKFDVNDVRIRLENTTQFVSTTNTDSTDTDVETQEN